MIICRTDPEKGDYNFVEGARRWVYIIEILWYFFNILKRFENICKKFYMTFLLSIFEYINFYPSYQHKTWKMNKIWHLIQRDLNLRMLCRGWK